MEQLANQGNPKAQYNIEIMYDQGIGVPQNRTKAVEWITKAAYQEFVRAQLYLGLIYTQEKKR